MAIIDVVKWDGSASELAWKFPSAELSTWTQLIVNEAQEAFVVNAGAYDGPFRAGRHTLSTSNIPLLRQLIGLPFGGRSPFTAEVWFVNRTAKLDIRWGTPDPIQLQDPKFGIMVPVRAFGQYGIAIDDSRKFLLKLVGALARFDASTLADYFRGAFATRIKTSIAAAIVDSGLSVLEVSTRLEDISAQLKESLAGDLAEYGVALSQFNVESINVPEADVAVQRLKAALAKRAEMNIVGYDYRQERSFDVLQAAARNEASAGAMVGAGLGAGMGLAVGASVGQAFEQLVTPTLQVNAATAPPVERAAAPAKLVERLELLKQLGELRSQNILTDAEFEAEKKRILAE
jgi:membrane protease subunit (stomatin/prohibitin family)